MICHKNLSLFFVYWRPLQRGQENILIGQKYFLGQWKCFLVPLQSLFNKQKQRSDKFLWQIMSLIFVTDHVTYFCDRLTELAFYHSRFLMCTSNFRSRLLSKIVQVFSICYMFLPLDWQKSKNCWWSTQIADFFQSL